MRLAFIGLVLFSCFMHLLTFIYYNIQVRVVSAHRTPELMYSYASSAHERGIQVIIAGAGGAAHLPGKLHELCSASYDFPCFYSALIYLSSI